MIDRYEKFVLYFCATSLGLLFISMAFVSQYYNYGAESVTAFSTLRVAKGLWHATDTADLPVTIYHYGGIFPYLVGLPLRLFSITDVYFVNILSKLAMCLLFFCNIKIILIYLKRFKPSFAIDAVVYSTLLFLLILPTLLFAYRPDLLCALCELGGFFLLFKHLEFKHESSRSIILAGMLFALATTLKFNSVSILVGCCAYLLFARNIRRLVVISTAYLSTLLVVGGLYHITLGPDYWVQSVFVASSGLPTLRAVSDLVIRLINEIGFRLILFHLIIVFGVINLKRARAHWRMCVCAVVSSLFFASIGQINIGAYYNYYYTYFFLAIFLAPFAYDEFLKIDWTIRRPVAITFSVLYLLLGVDSIKTSVQIYFNEHRNYPYTELKQYISDNYDNPVIYTRDSSLALHFSDQVMLGPWVEQVFTDSPYLLAGRTQDMQTALMGVEFDLAIFGGSNCETWRPQGVFRESIKDLTLLERQFRKLCLFARE